MKFQDILFICLMLCIILSSINFISATDYSDEYSLTFFVDENDLIDDVDVLASDDVDVLASDDVDVLASDDVDVLASDDDVYVAYVGQNTTENGDGSSQNPFANLTLACNDANSKHRTNVTINIKEGTYYLGNDLIFDTDNLIIQGEGNVVITNQFDHKFSGMATQLYGESIGLTSSSSNFTMSNLSFINTRVNDAFDKDLGTVNPRFEGILVKTYFYPFYGSTSLGIFKNCSFKGFKNKNQLTGSEYNSKFINCVFLTNDVIFSTPFADNTEHIFEYCVFQKNNLRIVPSVSNNRNVSMDSIWVGINEVPKFYYQIGTSEYYVPVSRYAIFNVTHNYLGNNQYEILGKLTWNGTGDQDGMENFQPMTVKLVSTTGDINQTATLVNGNFRTIYTSSNSTHYVTATLDNQPIDLEFFNVNITADPVSIYYGENQNVTLNFTQAITANVTLTVSNESFRKEYNVSVVNNNSTIYTIPDTLKEGTYDVEINLAENNLFGFNITTLTVSKVSDYTFDVVAGDVKVGENATISITLPEDVNGTVIVKFGNDTKELSANQTMTVNFTNLNATTYSVNVSYSGNDKYVPLDKPTSVTVNKADSNLEIEDAIFTYGDVIAIPFNVTNANGVTVSVLNKDDDEIATASSESGTINLDTLPAGEYTLEATTIVGSNYEWVSKTIDLTINKANSSIDIQDKEFVYAAEAIINTVTENSTGDVIATLTDENNTEIAVTVSGDDITLPKLNTGKYTLTVTTNPDENHNNVTKTATITINKAAPSMNVIIEPVENITTKDNVTLTISLPSDATGEVTVKINGKKTDIKSANETITIDLNNQAGDYVVDVTYSGDKNYESEMTTQEYIVSKAETSITAKQIDFEEGNASKIEVTVPDVESGIVLVDVAGKKFYGDIENGKATITLEGVSEGNYTANIKFFGDDKYNQAITTTDVKVSEDKIITELKEQLEEANAKVDNLTDELSNATDKIADLTAELNETQANATKLSEDLADAQANVTKLSDDLTDANARVDNLTVELNETQANATKLSEDLADANQKVNNLTTQLEKAQSNVTIVVDGVEYPVDVINGTATIKTNSTPSNTTIDLLDTKFNVTEGQSIGTYAVDYPAGERGKTFQFQLTDANGNPIKNATVQFAYKTVIFNKTTDENGIVILGVSTQFADSYLCALSYLGDETHKAAFVAFNFKLDKKQITITAKAKTFKSTLKTKKFTVTLKTKAHASKDGKTYLKAGKKVTLKINGKTYTAKINSKGKATFKITKLTKKGKFIATVKFTGDKTYKAATKKVKITIK